MPETDHKKVFINTVAKKEHESTKIKFSCLIASAKFQSAMEAFVHPTFLDNYQILYSDVFVLSILWMIYYLSILRSALSIRVVAVI